MELALFVYLAEAVGNISVVAIRLLTIGVVPLIIINVVKHEGNYRCGLGEDRKALRFSIKSGMFYSLAWLVICFVPSKTTMYTMAGAYAGQQVALAPETSEIMSKTLKIINKKLDEELK